MIVNTCNLSMDKTSLHVQGPSLSLQPYGLEHEDHIPLDNKTHYYSVTYIDVPTVSPQNTENQQPTIKEIEDRYKTSDIIGEGTFGLVHVAFDTIRKQDVAIKILKKETEYGSAGGMEEGLAEVTMLCKLSEFKGSSKRFCVEMLEWYNSGDVFQIVFPLYGENILSFRERNKNHAHFLIEDVRLIAYQLCHAVRFLHRHGMIHTDIKLCNIVFVDNEYYEYERVYPNFVQLDGTPLCQTIVRVRRPLIKLIDFGSAVWSPNKNAEYCHCINTRVYRAPEVIMNLNWGKASDIWSVACTIFELLYGQSLFDTDDDLEHLSLIEKTIGKFPKSMIKGSPLQDMFDASDSVVVCDDSIAEIVEEQYSLKEYVLNGGSEYWQLYDLLEKMFKVDPTKRVTMCRAVYHQFFTGSILPWPTEE